MSNDEKNFTKTSFNLFGKQNVKISQRKVTTKKRNDFARLLCRCHQSGGCIKQEELAISPTDKSVKKSFGQNRNQKNI